MEFDGRWGMGLTNYNVVRDQERPDGLKRRSPSELFAAVIYPLMGVVAIAYQIYLLITQ